MKKILAMLAIMLLVSAPVLAQEIDYCEGDFDYDGDCDGTDATRFKQDFGRSVFENPCPPDGPVPVAKTGQTTSYATGDDGDLETGVAWPNPRFTDNSDGTITDNLTGLIWLKNGNCFGERTWYNALSDCNGLENGECGLTDGSSVGEWRLPNRFELESLLDLGNYSPAFPSGHPFYSVQSGSYWSSSTSAHLTYYSWLVGMSDGYVGTGYRSNYFYAWPVRGGH